MMRVSLVFNHIGVAGMSDCRPDGDREGSWIGHGIASVGASAKKNGYNVDLIDLRRISGWDAFESIIINDPADVYGFSVSAVDHWHALKAILIVKRNLPDSKIIVGGIHPTIFPGEYEFDVIDSVVQGEGEVTFTKILDKIHLDKSLPKVIRGEKPDLDKIQWIDRELFDYSKELKCGMAPDQSLPAITMLAGRGCPYKCAYCQPAENAVFGHPYRMRSPENVVAELSYLKCRYRYKSVTFWDDTFTFNSKWVRDFCDLYESAKIGADIVACSRADIICKNEGMIERLSEIGLKWFVIGLESGSQRILNLIQKGTTVEQNKRAAKICRKYGIKIFGTYMFGLPTETVDESLATARMIDEISPEHASPFWFVPIKGTKIYDTCKEKGLILSGTEDRTIERTGCFNRTMKDVDYNYITMLMKGYRGKPGYHERLGW